MNKKIFSVCAARERVQLSTIFTYCWRRPRCWLFAGSLTFAFDFFRRPLNWGCTPVVTSAIIYGARAKKKSGVRVMSEHEMSVHVLCVWVEKFNASLAAFVRGMGENEAANINLKGFCHFSDFYLKGWVNFLFYLYKLEKCPFNPRPQIVFIDKEIGWKFSSGNFYFKYSFATFIVASCKWKPFWELMGWKEHNDNPQREKGEAPADRIHLYSHSPFFSMLHSHTFCIIFHHPPTIFFAKRFCSAWIKKLRFLLERERRKKKKLEVWFMSGFSFLS